MRSLLLAAISVAAIATGWQSASAGDVRAAAPPPTRPLPAPAKANACAAFGPGFVQLEGSSTCVKAGGAISVEGGVRR